MALVISHCNEFTRMPAKKRRFASGANALVSENLIPSITRDAHHFPCGGCLQESFDL